MCVNFSGSGFSGDNVVNESPAVLPKAKQMC